MHMLSLYSLGLSSFVQRSIDEGYNGKYILTFFYLSPVLDNINIHCLSGPPECRPKSKEVMNYNYSEGPSFLFSLFYENTTKTWIYQNNPTDKTFGFTFASVYLLHKVKMMIIDTVLIQDYTHVRKVNILKSGSIWQNIYFR